MFSRLAPLIKKEVRQILRDKRVLVILTLVPAIMLLINGFALNLDVRNIRLAIVDQDRSSFSRQFVNSFITSGYFELRAAPTTTKEAQELLDAGAITVVLVIPAGFGSDVLADESAKIQVLVDGMDSNSATTIIGYVQVITLQYSQKILMEQFARMGMEAYVPVRLEARMWYNPELRSAKFLVPGLIGFILAITAVIATSLSIVREKERNTIEQISVAPIKPMELIVGKMTPYVFISLIAAALVIVAAYVLFDVEVKGSLLHLFGATLLFIIAALGIGLFVSTIADSQQVAFQIASVVSMLPTVILSGFLFPIRSMPWWLQVLSNITPAKFYLVILRGIVLKGVGLEAFWDQVLYLILYATVLLSISALRFKRSLG
jgi:ABC-2 type transport system permease protein